MYNAVSSFGESMTKSITLTDFLSLEEIDKALAIFKSDKSNFHRRCRDEVIAPVMNRINADLGQQNDVDYLAYAVEHVFNQIVK